MRNFKNEFYKNEISIIDDFFDSKEKILFVKRDNNILTDFLSETFLKRKDNDLFFYYFCTEFTVLEDILLNYYDTLRNFSIKKNINLQKSIEEDFGKKIISYIKAIREKSFIIIDNFENINNNKQILYFLQNLIKSTNSKIILISDKNSSPEVFEEYNVNKKVISLNQITDNISEDFLNNFLPNSDKNTIEIFKNLVQSNDFSFITSLNYTETTGSKIESLIEEFSNRKTSYENFIINKALSLVPGANLEELKFISMMNNPLTSAFIQKYSIIPEGQIEYLIGKSILSNFLENITIPNQYVNFFKKNFTVGEKHFLAEKAIKIYENEITKKPQDRLLRLSREGLRRQIGHFAENKSNVNMNFAQDLGYNFDNGHENIKAPWLNIPNKQEKESVNLDKINQKDIKLLRKINEEKQKDLEIISQKKMDIDSNEIKNMIKEAENNFQYNEAIGLLHTLKDKSVDNDTISDNKIYDRIAKNLLNSNKNQEAIIYYSKISDNYRNTSDYNNCALYELKIAEIYEHIYNFEQAEKRCEKVINSQFNLNANIIALAYYRLGKIKEKSNEENIALQNYQHAYNLVQTLQDKKLLSKIAFALGVLNNKLENIQEAKEFYLKTIEFLEDKQNKNSGTCYMNLANIFYDEENDTEAVKYYELAKSEFLKDEENNLSGLYYSNRNLANIYKNVDTQKCGEFLEEEFKYAKEIGDNFKIINAVVELGDYFYNISEDRKALVYYLYAKNTLSQSDNSAQNKEMINMRIEDMRHRMPSSIFEGIIKEHG